MEEKKGMNILIIEDNSIFRKMLAEKFKSAGYAVSFLGSDTTLDKIKGCQPKLALINIATPKEVGLKIIEEMSQDRELSSVAVMAIAKTEGSVLIDHARKYGVKYMIDKAIFDPEQMLKNVSFLLTDRQEGGVAEREEEFQEMLEKNIIKTSDEGVVLLVEDDVFMRGLFTESLRDAGFEVCDAEDAIVAEKIFKEKTPDIVLLDLLLPGKSGFQFLSEMKSKKECAHIPVVVISNLGSKGDIDRALDLGAADFLVKANATIDEIIAKAKEHIQKSKKTPKLPESVMNEDL